jgi:hypothetical protein
MAASKEGRPPGHLNDAHDWAMILLLESRKMLKKVEVST